MKMPTSESTTRGVRVAVKSEFVAERSIPEEGKYFFVYHIKITNDCDKMVQLVSRHWIITDSNGVKEEVQGPGVVGKQPVLDVGQSFEYTSFCPLGTSFGTMHGTYQVVTRDGQSFDVQIAPFKLAAEEMVLH